jgi:hypothetical protein
MTNPARVCLVQAMSGSDGMDSSPSLFGIIVPSRGMGLFRLSASKEELEMNLTTIAVDSAKDVFEMTVAVPVQFRSENRLYVIYAHEGERGI